MLQTLHFFCQISKISARQSGRFRKILQKRVLTCKDRCRYSRKRAKSCRKFAKNWQLPYGSSGSPVLRRTRALNGEPRGSGHTPGGATGHTPSLAPSLILESLVQTFRAHDSRYHGIAQLESLESPWYMESLIPGYLVLVPKVSHLKDSTRFPLQGGSLFFL